MSGFRQMAESYEELLRESNVDIATAEKLQRRIKSYLLLDTISKDDYMQFFYTGIYNEIVINYCEKAMKNCFVSRDKILSVKEELEWLLTTEEY